MRGRGLFYVATIIILLALPVVSALSEGDRLVWVLTEEYNGTRAVVKLYTTVVDNNGVLALSVDDVEVVEGDLLFASLFALLEGELIELDVKPGTPIAAACDDLALLAPGVSGTYTEDGLYCKYEDGVLVEARFADPELNYTLKVKLEGGFGSLAYPLLLAVVVLALLGAVIFIVKKHL